MTDQVISIDEAMSLREQIVGNLYGDVEPVTIGNVEPDFVSGRVATYKLSNPEIQAWATAEVEWLLEDAVPVGSNVVVGASEKTLKSTLSSVGMTVALAEGKPWLGHFRNPSGQGKNILLVINEAMRPILRTMHLMIDQSIASDRIFVVNGTGLKIEDIVEDVKAAIENHNIDVTLWDAMYGFVGGDVNAASVFSMGDLLAFIKTLGDKTATTQIVIHHFRKHTTGRPQRTDLSWAGFAEWADTWILLCHREEPRPDDGEYRLGMIAGTRQASEHAYNVDVSVDPELNSTVAPVFLCEQVPFAETKKWGAATQGEEHRELERLQKEQSAAEVIAQALADDPWTHTKTDLAGKCDTRRPGDAAIASMKDQAQIESGRVSTLRKGRTYTVDVWGFTERMKGKAVAGVNVPQDYPTIPKADLL
jgi:hypothetical protein